MRRSTEELHRPLPPQPTEEPAPTLPLDLHLHNPATPPPPTNRPNNHPHARFSCLHHRDRHLPCLLPPPQRPPPALSPASTTTETATCPVSCLHHHRDRHLPCLLPPPPQRPPPALSPASTIETATCPVSSLHHHRDSPLPCLLPPPSRPPPALSPASTIETATCPVSCLHHRDRHLPCLQPPPPRRTPAQPRTRPPPALSPASTIETATCPVSCLHHHRDRHLPCLQPPPPRPPPALSPASTTTETAPSHRPPALDSWPITAPRGLRVLQSLRGQLGLPVTVGGGLPIEDTAVREMRGRAHAQKDVQRVVPSGEFQMGAPATNHAKPVGGSALFTTAKMELFISPGAPEPRSRALPPPHRPRCRTPTRG
ncbi:unnamed protein product [Boreogadus saida]